MTENPTDSHWCGGGAVANADEADWQLAEFCPRCAFRGAAQSNHLWNLLQDMSFVSCVGQMEDTKTAQAMAVRNNLLAALEEWARILGVPPSPCISDVHPYRVDVREALRRISEARVAFARADNSLPLDRARELKTAATQIAAAEAHLNQPVSHRGRCQVCHETVDLTIGTSAAFEPCPQCGAIDW